MITIKDIDSEIEKLYIEYNQHKKTSRKNKLLFLHQKGITDSELIKACALYLFVAEEKPSLKIQIIDIINKNTNFYTAIIEINNLVTRD